MNWVMAEKEVDESQRMQKGIPRCRRAAASQAPDTGEQECDQIREGQLTVSGEKPGVTSGGAKEISTMNVVRQPGNDFDIFRQSYNFYLYQLVTGCIISWGGMMTKFAKLDDKSLSQEGCLGGNRKRLHSTLGYRSPGQMSSDWFLEQEQEKQTE